MNEINRINKRIFKEGKNFKLFLVFDFVLSLFIVGTIFSYVYCYSKIENAINDEQNKIINVKINGNYNDFEKFYGINKKKIENKFIDIYIQDVELLNEHFDLISSENDFDEQTIAIKISKKYNNKSIVKILDFNNFNIYYTNEENNLIFCNQLFSEKILQEGHSGMIYLTSKNYNDLQDILNELKDFSLEANVNINENNNNIYMYMKTQKIIIFVFVAMLLLTIFITLFQLIQLFSEQKKNLFIYNVIGLNLSKIYIMYIKLILYYSGICYFINLFICNIIGILFVHEFNIVLFFELNLLTIMIIIIINIVESFIQFANIRKNKDI